MKMKTESLLQGHICCILLDAQFLLTKVSHLYPFLIWHYFGSLRFVVVMPGEQLLWHTCMIS